MSNRPTRAFVAPIKDRSSDTDRIKQLIKAAGCDVVCEDSGRIDSEKCLQEADVLVVLICREMLGDTTINDLVVSATRSGKRVVGVWAADATDYNLPPVINKHGDAVIPCTLKAVKEAICGGQPTWLTPDGKERPKPKTPRHKG